MMKKANRKVREKLLERLRYELIGYEHEKEILNNKPSQKYLAGLLWPMQSSVAAEENETDNVNGKDTSKELMEGIAPLAKAMNPSAIGLSFLVDKQQPEIFVNVEFGMYEEIGEKKWARIPFKLNNFIINLTEEIGVKRTEGIPRKELKVGRETKEPIQIEWIVRPYNNSYAVSLFLVNRYIQEVDEHDVDHKCVFQPKIIVQSSDAFMVRNAFSNNEKGFQDEDTKSNELLYRNEGVYGVGHSISVNWKKVNELRSRASVLETEIIPAYEIPMVLPPNWNKGGTLDMEKLASMKTSKEIEEALTPLLNEYGKWIKDRWKEIDDEIEEEYKDTAILHIRRCQDSLDRMWSGITKLSDRNVLDAFLFSNKVMSEQRAHTEAIESGKLPSEIKSEWRPFQIAFFLQNIEGVVEPTSNDRNIADLLWFPTGGGKTEAYLGIAAFTLAYRRLMKIQGYRTDVGVSVIMRYTLRLLTIQQFQRATAMICACENIRNNSPEKWGNTRFRIGLWVGDSSVPNKYEDAKKVIKAKEEAISRKIEFIKPNNIKGTPIQLVSCPWCGEKLVDDKDNPKIFFNSYKIKDKKKRLFICCPNTNCDFHKSNTNGEGLPVLITDEEIYRLLPDMVIGTVDKFARMPWEPQIQNLFGKVKGEVANWGFMSHGGSQKELVNIKNVAGNTELINKLPVHPPNLIIQDELHLISGPLGTMVGLYETAVDYLSTVTIDGIEYRPKVIASTATIKNAHKQISGLYTRDTQIFPSPGLTHKDSFFAKQRKIEEQPGRMYVGLFAPGRSMKTAQLRVYANLLSSVTAMESISEFDQDNLDPYQTLIGYFNSIRELGGAVRLIEDDVPARMKTLQKQYSEENRFQFKHRELDRDVPELTSRIDSGKIPMILDRLLQPFNEERQLTPVDVLLASNMISVGVDVPRLGLMVVNGQPKTTAEYIQSTSRAGRRHPGLIITLYNWARPRDISHYEEFFAYHAALYRYVEPISVTPFASRARDRGLAAVLVSMLRLGFGELSNNSAASNFDKVSDLSDGIIKVFLKRAIKIDITKQDLEGHLEQLIERWEEDSNKSRMLYSYKKNENESNLLYPLGEDPSKGTYNTPNSMRDVESVAGIYIRKD
ncbi:DISARM system helicase DrmA [Sutcliffiella sp. NC1]|uniref:DISARM system helicase DrmA n=1 Tax=Sutcliffiella sp. NC1 TaxID=3004096 RepID=UPI0022DCEDD4|nr:DISARM system helicase DrmA [Sutcliffiella sp. NC1]WBL16874.1 DISARM system helicase DrmA [Sutcliffiella sp. NC1]